MGKSGMGETREASPAELCRLPAEDLGISLSTVKLPKDFNQGNNIIQKVMLSKKIVTHNSISK